MEHGEYAVNIKLKKSVWTIWGALSDVSKREALKYAQEGASKSSNAVYQVVNSRNVEVATFGGEV